MYDESGEARKTTAFATSSDEPERPIGIHSGAALAPAASATGVAIGPQATTFIRMPSRLYSAATDRARLVRPAFAAPYAACSGLPALPVIEPTLTIVPPVPCSRKRRNADLTTRAT